MEKTLRPAPASMALALLLAAVFVWAFLPVWSGLVRAWEGSEDYAHGFLILPLALYIVWRNRAELARTPRETSWLGLATVVSALGLYLFGFYAGVSTIASLSLVLAAGGMVAFLFGARVLRRCAFPLFLLLFMIPLPAQVQASLTAPLQLMVSKTAASVIRLFDIPIFREGNILHLPERSFQVIQACSGLRSIISLLTLSVLMAFFTLRRPAVRILLFLAGVPVAMLVNMVRVVLMILALHYLGIDLTGGRLHTAFGLGIFLLALAILFLLQRCLARWETASEAKPSS